MQCINICFNTHIYITIVTRECHDFTRSQVVQVSRLDYLPTFVDLLSVFHHPILSF